MAIDSITADQLIQLSRANVTAIPLHSEKHVSIPQYHAALKQAKNKGQMLRAALRTLSSLGYHSNVDPDLWEKIEPYMEDFKE